MENKSENELFSFDDSIVLPVVVLSEKNQWVNDITKGYVIAKVNEYDGPIESYDVTAPMANLSKMLSASMSVDIQEQLGEQDGTRLKYEFYLTSSVLADYKFRIMFIEYGITGYPVKIVLEQGIADEFLGEENSDYVVMIDDYISFKNAVDKILNTNRVIEIMQSLINVGLNNIKTIF